jgi:hypothetical protein
MSDADPVILPPSFARVRFRSCGPDWPLRWLSEEAFAVAGSDEEPQSTVSACITFARCVEVAVPALADRPTRDEQLFHVLELSPGRLRTLRNLSRLGRSRELFAAYDSEHFFLGPGDSVVR